MFHQVVLPFVGGSNSAERLKDCYVYFLRRNQDPAPRLHYCLFPGLCIPSLPWLATTLWNSGKVMESEAHSLKQEIRGHREACVPRSPTGPCWVTPWITRSSYPCEQWGETHSRQIEQVMPRCWNQGGAWPVLGTESRAAGLEQRTPHE